MAIQNFIPTIWSETLYQEMDRHHIGVAHCNRDFEGDIREKGNVVKICGLENVDVYDYQKNTDMNTPDTLKDFSTDLVIDHAKYFNFQIDDIDRVQASPQLMKLAMANAAKALANTADYAIMNMDTTNIPTLKMNVYDPTVESIFQNILYAREKLSAYSLPSNDELYLEVSPYIASLILRAQICTSSDNNHLIETGSIGNILGCKVYVSKNISLTKAENVDYDVHRCFLRTKRAVTFAEQLSEIQAYRPERRFADAIKGLYLFGFKVVYPNEFLELNFTVDTAMYPLI